MNLLHNSIASWANSRKPVPRPVALRVTELEDRWTPAVNGLNVFGAAFGQPPVVTVTRPDGSVLAQVLAYDPAFRGGVSAALGEIDGNPNTIELVTGAGPGGGPHVKVFSIDATGAITLEASFLAFAPGFTGGVSVAAGDITGDGRAEVVVGAGPGGGPHVRSFIVNPFISVVPVPGPLGSFFAFAAGFRGGVNVAAGDLTGDGRAEVVTVPSAGFAPHVRVWQVANGTATDIGSFFAFEPSFTGGVSPAVADVNGDGRAEIVVTPGAGGGPV
ncbi:MAG TPA: VCBS repeat-containing protein, partial [Gemmataceae bacterium]